MSAGGALNGSYANTCIPNAVVKLPADPPPDPPVADDADRRAVQVTHGKMAAIRPAAMPDEIGRRPQPLDEMQGQREHTLGYRPRSAARRDDDRNASCRGRWEIDVIDTNTGACDDAQPWGAREKPGIDDGVGTDDRPDGVGDVACAWFGDERNLFAEDPGDQRRIDGAKCHNHRTVDSHAVTHSPQRLSPGLRRMSHAAPLGLAATCHVRTKWRRRR